MDNFRKVLAIGLTAVCVVFGLPANAQNPSQQVTLTMVGPSDTSKTVVANLFNHSNPSGGGTSNFGSAQLIVDTHTSGMRITLTDLKLERVDTSNNATPVTGVSVALSSDGSTLSITGISPTSASSPNS